MLSSVTTRSRGGWRPAGAHVRPRRRRRGGRRRRRRRARLGPAQVGALAAAGVAESSCAAARAPPCSPPAPSSARRASRSSRARSTRRTARMLAAALAAAGAEVERLVRRRRRARRTARRSSGRSRPTSRHLRRRLGRSARPRPRRRGRARRRGGLLARRGQAGQAGLVRRARRGRSSSACPETRSRRSSASSSSSARRCSRSRASDDPGPRSSSRALCPRRSAGTRARRARARAQPATDDGVVLEPVAGQESHMIVRAAAADALVLVPRGGRGRSGSAAVLVDAPAATRPLGSPGAYREVRLAPAASRPPAARRRCSDATRRSAGGTPAAPGPS